jgi:hypothetical protein
LSPVGTHGSVVLVVDVVVGATGAHSMRDEVGRTVRVPN